MEEAKEKLSTLEAKVSSKLDRLDSDELDDVQIKSYLETAGKQVSDMERALRMLEAELKTAAMMSTVSDIESQRSFVQLQTGNVVGLKERYDKVKQTCERKLLLNLKRNTANSIEPRKNTEFTEADELLLEQNNTLSEANRAMLQTEEIALGVTSDLSSNRSKIEKARERNSTNHSNIGQSNEILQNMLNRENQRELVLKFFKALGGFFGILFLFKLLF